MKAIQKVFAMLLVVVMALGLSITAFAYTPTNGSCTVTFPGSSSANTPSAYNSGTISTENGRTWAGYKLMSLSTSPKCTDTSAEHTHSSACYLYAYEVNEKYRSILQTQVLAVDAEAEGNFWTKNDLTKPQDTTGVTDEVIRKYLESLQSNSEEIRAFADATYRAIQDESLEADETTITNSADIAQGYWLFADVTNLEGTTGTYHSVVLLATQGQENIEINAKTGGPTVDKEDTTSTQTTNTTNSVNVGDKVSYELTATMPEDLASYTTYQLVFHDTMTSGLTYNKDAKVYVVDENGTETKVSLGDNDISAVENETAGVTTTKLTVTLDNVKALTDSENQAIEVTTASKIIVRYTATLNGDALKTDVETNKVYLEYSNDPYDEYSTGETPEKEVDVYDFEVKIYKHASDETDTEKMPLDGAKFVLYKEVDGTAQYYHYNKTDNKVEWKTLAEIIGALNEANDTKDDWTALDDSATLTQLLALDPKWGVTDYIDEVTTDKNGNASFKGLAAGTYYLYETAAPDGYNLLKDPVEVTITTTKDAETKVVTATATGGTLLGSTVTVDVANSTGTELPETGGIGTTIFYVVGSILVVGAAVLLIVKKRMNGTER